jgi:hypothetical protein
VRGAGPAEDRATPDDRARPIIRIEELDTIRHRAPGEARAVHGRPRRRVSVADRAWVDDSTRLYSTGTAAA